VETKNSMLEQGDEPGTPHVTIAVSDTGTGITQATLAHIFEPFFTTKEVGKGTGLGLSTVYTIIQQFDGYIHVFSEPGLGTTFSIQLPRITAPRESVVPIAQGPLDALRGNEVVLLVEDAAAVRSVARQVLERFGYTVLEAPDGATALHLASKLHGPVDVLVTDLVMPGMSGQDLAAGFRALRPKAKVLYTSGYNEKGTHHHRELDPSLPFLQKPFTPETLARKVRETLDAP
jgi:CheY-like chemotaxis protein